MVERRVGIGGTALAGALAALLAACASGASGASGATHPTPTATSLPNPTATAAAHCQGTQLAAAITAGGAAATHILTQVSLRNISQQVCSLDGYPTLQLLDAAGHPLPTHVTDATSAYLWSSLSPGVVVLAPGASAIFKLQWSQVDYTTGAACTSPPSSSLQITPPGATDALTAAAQLTPCDGDLITSPIVPGS